MDLHWDKGIDLPAGSTLSRVAPRKEKSVNPSGFYASFRNDDLDRYKAILPTYWKDWGVGDAARGGFVNEFTAKSAVRAPSGSETVDIYRSMMMGSKKFRESEGHFIPDADVASYFSSSIDWKERTRSFSHFWSDPSDPTAQMFFNELKSRGYNAVIDFNNAGAISHSPLKVIDGSIFEVSGSRPLSLQDMVAASKKPHGALKHFHSEEGVGRMSFDIDLLGPPEEDDSLAHYGIKGMRWGVRRSDGPEGTVSSGTSSKKDDQPAPKSAGSKSSSGKSEGLTDGQKKALKYAAGGALVAGALIGTAVLARNGKIPISSLQNSVINKNSFASQTRRMAKIPGTIANREAQLADAAEFSRTMKPEFRAQFMQRVTARLDAEQERRIASQTAIAQRIAQNAASDARAAEMASRRQIVRNQANALARSGDRNRLQSAVDGVSIRADSHRATRAMSNAANAQQRADAAERKKSAADGGSSRLENVQTLLEAASMGRDAVSSIRSSPMWNQPATNLQSQTTQDQRRQIVAAQRQAAENERNAQNRSRRGRN